MNKVQYLAVAKVKAAKQVSERGHTLVDVAKRVRMSDKSLLPLGATCHRAAIGRHYLKPQSLFLRR